MAAIVATAINKISVFFILNIYKIGIYIPIYLLIILSHKYMYPTLILNKAIFGEPTGMTNFITYLAFVFLF